MKSLTFIKAAGSELTAAQPKVILQVLEAKFGVGIPVTFEELGKALSEDPTFVSRQKAELVVAYYAKRLADAGYVKYDIVVEETPVAIPTDEAVDDYFAAQQEAEHIESLADHDDKSDDEMLVPIPPAPRDIFADEPPKTDPKVAKAKAAKAKAAKAKAKAQ
jgi:hypothetical protein